MKKTKYDNYSKEQLIDKLNRLEKKKYGLVWDDKPETVAEKCEKELPILVEDKSKEIISDSQNSTNLILEGDNYHALYVLNFTHQKKIDVIYIDPPYNTGSKDWKYNNDYVDKDDRFKHSKWLSFMSKRLKLSKKLLKNNGVIVVTIDDYELFSIGLLLDKIFGEQNKIGVIAIEVNPRGRTTNSFFATSHEYILMYAKNINEAKIFNLPLTEEQENNFNLKDNISSYRLLPFRRSGGLSTPDERPNSEFDIYVSKTSNKIIAVGGKRTKAFPEKYCPEYVKYISANGLIKTISPQDFLEEHKDDIIHILPIDVSGKRRVWRWSDRDKILKSSMQGDFDIFYSKEKYTIKLKDRIKEGRKPKTIWVNPKYDASSHGTVLIEKILGSSKMFNYPKSIHAVTDTLNTLVLQNKNAIVLDFFAGSGSTAHAVLKLNKQDGGNRQFIVCTNNEVGEKSEKEFCKKYNIPAKKLKNWRNGNKSEWLDWCEKNGICSTVTYPRIKNVVNGYANIDGIHANVKYFKTDFVPTVLTDNDKRILVEKSTELLCIAENTFNVARQKEILDYAVFSNSKQHTAIIYDENFIGECCNKLNKIQLKNKTVIYVFSYDHFYDKDDFKTLDIDFIVKPIPEAIINVYRKISKLKNK